MGAIDLEPTPAAKSTGWSMRVLAVAITVVLAGGLVAAGLRLGDDPDASVATAQDLELIHSSPGAVEALEGIEMTMRFEIDGHTLTMDGTGNTTHGRFALSGPGFDDIAVIQVGDRSYLPAIGGPGWAEFIAPQGTAAEATAAVSGQDPLDHLRSISSTAAIEILGRGSVDGVDVTRYRTRVELADALEAAQGQFGGLGASPADINAVLADASPMQIDVEIDDVGLPRRTQVRYEVQGVTFDMEVRLRPVDAMPAIEAPPAAEIVSSQQAADGLQFQQLVGQHIAQFALA